MKNKNFTWLSLAFFSISILMVFTASECEGTPEEEVNTHIEFISPAEESFQGYGRQDNISYISIHIKRNDNEQDISLGVSDTSTDLEYHFYHDILYGSSSTNSSLTTLKISNVLSLSEEINQITLYAQAPGQTVYTTFYLAKQYFSLNLSPNTIDIEQGEQGVVSVGLTPINNFNCRVELDCEGLPSDVYSYWNPSIPQIGLNQTASLTFTTYSNSDIGNFIITIIGESDYSTNSTGCDFLEKDTAYITLNITAPALWTDVTPDPAPPTLYDIDGEYAVGENGTIIKTMNEGLNWEYLSSGTSSTLRAVLNAGGTIYIAGDNGTVLRGGGSSWSDISIPETPDIYEIHKVDSHLWAVGTDGAGAVAFKSRDDGLTWMKSNTPYNQSFYEIFFGVSFSDTSNGIIVGNLHSNIFRTADAGETWDIIPVNPLQLEYISGNIACGVNGSILSTPDGGLTWQNLNIGMFGNLSSFSNDIFVGYHGTVVRQESGSYNLEETGIHNFQSDLLGVTLNGTYIAVGTGGASVGVIIKRQPL